MTTHYVSFEPNIVIHADVDRIFHADDWLMIEDSLIDYDDLGPFVPQPAGLVMPEPDLSLADDEVIF